MNIYQLILIIITEVIAQGILEESIKTDNKIYLYIGLMLYFIIGYIFYLMLKSGDDLAISNGIWSAGSIVGSAIIGFLIFNQTLNLSQIFGLILNIIGLLIYSVKYLHAT